MSACLCENRKRHPVSECVARDALRERIADAIVDTWRVAMTDEATVLGTARRFADAALSAITEVTR